jgi:type IV fimbrial biogenesis protein FimT
VTVTPLATVLPARARRAAGGFTLIELLVTVVVLSILLSLGVPAFRSFMQNDQQWAQTNTLVVGLNSARSEAVKNDLTAGAQVCSSNDGTRCTATAWDQGWIVLGVNPADPRGPLKPLQVVGALPAGTTLTEASNNLIITFVSNGTLLLQNPAARVAFTMCDARGAAYARYLEVTLMGRVVASRVVGQKLDGVPLTCP